MANKINVKLILELRAASMTRNAIAATRHMSKNSVGDVFHIADTRGITYQDVRGLSDEQVYRMFYPEKHLAESVFYEPDYGYAHQELRKTGVTLKLLWQEYRTQCNLMDSIPMGYTKYCSGYDSYTMENRLVSHLEHKPGIITEVDWSGPTMSYVDVSTGEIVTVYLFVATLPYSQYSYVECCLDMKQV